VAAADSGAARAARQPAPLQAAPVAVAHRAVTRLAATSGGCTMASVGAGARAAVRYAPFPAPRSPAPKARENAAQGRRFCGVAAVAGRETAAAPATKQMGFAAQVAVAAAVPGTAATLQQRLSHKARMCGKALLAVTCRCKTAGRIGIYPILTA